MIYFILSPETNTIKIGYTENNVKFRLSNLQTGNPVFLTVIQVIEGDLETEKQLHEEFAEYRQQGEWFYFGEKLRRFITSLNCEKAIGKFEKTKTVNDVEKALKKLKNKKAKILYILENVYKYPDYIYKAEYSDLVEIKNGEEKLINGSTFKNEICFKLLREYDLSTNKREVSELLDNILLDRRYYF